MRAWYLHAGRTMGDLEATSCDGKLNDDSRSIFDCELLIVVNPPYARPGWLSDCWLKTAIVDAVNGAEDRYGQRDGRFRIGEVHVAAGFKSGFSPIGDSHVDYLLKLYLGRNIGTLSQLDLLGLIAHECVHFLSYLDKKDITVLEEGAAESFAASRCPGCVSHDPAYIRARDAVERLESLCPSVIKSLRVSGGPFCNLTAEQLRTACPKCSKQLANKLAEKFYRGNLPAFKAPSRRKPARGRSVRDKRITRPNAKSK